MAFKLSLVADVRDWLRGTADVEQSLDDLADSLDALDTTDTSGAVRAVEDIGDEATTSAKQLEDKFSAALHSVRADAKKSGDTVGREMHAGTRKAEAGLSDLKDESQSTAREAAASFDGSAESIVDMFQEVSANAFAGFGPAGALAGLAAAAGIGLAKAALDGAAESATAAKEHVLDLAGQLDDVDGDQGAIDWATELRDRLNEITDSREWFEFWQDTPKTRLEEWQGAAERFGISWSDIIGAMRGDTESLTSVQTDLTNVIETNRARLATETGWAGGAADNAAAAEKLRDAITKEGQAVQDAAAYHDLLTTALGSLEDATTDAQTATEDYQAAVVDDLDAAGKAWADYSEKGKVNLDEYNANIEAHAAAVERFEANLVTSSQHLSDEALNYIRGMGPEAAPLLQAFADAPLAQKKRTAQNWDTLGRAATDGYRQSLNIDRATADAAARAQGTASANPVRMLLTVDSSRLQSDVSNARARISAAPITIPIRGQRVATLE